MAPKAKLLLVALLLACLALALPASASAARCDNDDMLPVAGNFDKVRSTTLCLLNAERTSRGLGRLRSDRQLAKAARRFSAHMVRERFFGHVSPAGSTLSSRVRGGTSYLRGPVRTWSLGENLAWGAGELATPRNIVRGWMESRGHRANILDGRFRHVGIGVVTGAPADTRGQAAATYTTDFGFRARR